MKEILNMLGSAKYVLKIGLKWSYLQIPLEEKSKPITAFTVSGKRISQNQRTSFDLTKVPAHKNVSSDAHK